MERTKEQELEWDAWLAERPKNVREVAEKIVPWKSYRNIEEENDLGNRYSPVSYSEEPDGKVTVNCHKTNKECPPLGGYGVFGMDPAKLIEADTPHTPQL